MPQVLFNKRPKEQKLKLIAFEKHKNEGIKCKSLTGN